MNKKFIFGILVLGVLITASFVSAGLFSKMTITGNAISGGWTDWIDRDNPTGNGDYEVLSDIIDRFKITCDNPTAIECRTVDGKIDSDKTGQNVVCDSEYGFYCLNKANGGSYTIIDPVCEDYEVRFYCGDGSCGDGICDNEETASTCSIDCGEENVCTDTCSSMGYECGTQTVCGSNVNCGTCANGEVCSSGECVKESTCLDTCSSLGYACGNHVICGENVNCGTCTSGEVTYQGVLNMLSSCESRRRVLTNISSEITGNDICGNIGKHCLMTFEAGHYKTVQGISVKMEDFSVSGIGEDCDYKWMPSTSAFYQGADHMSIQAICCSAP